jgi:hypothetical protein
MAIDFSDFLERMGNETNGPKVVREEKKSEPIIEPRIESRPEPKAKSTVREVQEIPDEVPETHQDIINEEFMDKAYDYANGVIKVIRTNFKNKEKIIMLESLQKAISLYLNNINPSSNINSNNISSSNNTVSRPQQQPSFLSTTMTEDEWNKIPVVQNETTGVSTVKLNDLTGTEVKLNQDYNKSLDLGVKLNEHGLFEADLSNITNKDIAEMKVLSGM